MNGNNTNGGGSNRTAMQIMVECDHSLLPHFSVTAFNSFIDGLVKMGLLPTVWDPTVERPPVLGVMLNFSRLQRRNYRLDGINLFFCWLENADFTGSSLRNARLGCGRNVSYRNCRLDNADFQEAEISGCDFTGCSGIETALFEGAVYDPANPPKGLPESILDRCKPAAAPPLKNPRQPSNLQEPSGYTVAPLRACVTIHEIPMSR